MLSKEKIETLYCKQRLSLAKVAKQVGVSAPTVSNWLSKYNIPRRTISQALTGRKLSKEHAAQVRKNTEKANFMRHLNGVPEKEKERLRKIRPDRTGCKHSRETKQKMSKAHMGKKISKETRKRMADARRGQIIGKNHPLYGMERPDMKGPNNPNWNGGISSLYKIIRRTAHYKEWRSKCFERDGYKCVKCKSRLQLEVDHIKPFAIIIYEHKVKTVQKARTTEDLWNVNNGRTLCKKCHRQTQTFAGRTKQMLAKIKNKGNIKAHHGSI